MLLSDLTNLMVLCTNGMQLQLMQAFSVSTFLRCSMPRHDGHLSWPSSVLRGTKQELQMESIIAVRLAMMQKSEKHSATKVPQLSSWPL